MLDAVPFQFRIIEHADHYARRSGPAVGIVLAQRLLVTDSGDITLPVVFALTAFGLPRP
ncbi:hypothetical protein QFZ75_000097 [Streptomyces sp. V3I8]|uniref:hypothetical protein n=1 Tax=Streptomyces sp. V3I8 TaxID=3042279 RepID=UPI00277D5164|nr:hypothetical protein [Streptomyces sp. V3I8]MDQ1033681.1 hypothetical protein [Streptomyces sp. V3I8]